MSNPARSTSRGCCPRDPLLDRFPGNTVGLDSRPAENPLHSDHFSSTVCLGTAQQIDQPGGPPVDQFVTAIRQYVERPVDPPHATLLTASNPIRKNGQMPSRIVIEHLEFHAHVGAIEEERRISQPIAVDIEVDWPTEQAGATDELHHTIDYARVAERLVQAGTQRHDKLLESMAERLLSTIFAEFPVEAAYVWVRKINPPVKAVQGSVGIQVKRTRHTHMMLQPDPLPARFLVEQLYRLPRGRALDVASGAGRNAMYLATNGFQVECIDRDEQALIALNSMAQARSLTATLSTRTVDLETDPAHIPDLGTEQYEVIMVFFYLYRPLFPRLIQALKPGGILVYETFTVTNHLQHQHPRRREFCLEPNELLRLVSPLHVLYYDEGEHAGSDGATPLFTAQLLAQKV